MQLDCTTYVRDYRAALTRHACSRHSQHARSQPPFTSRSAIRHASSPISLEQIDSGTDPRWRKLTPTDRGNARRQRLARPRTPRQHPPRRRTSDVPRCRMTNPSVSNPGADTTNRYEQAMRRSAEQLDNTRPTCSCDGHAHASMTARQHQVREQRRRLRRIEIGDAPAGRPRPSRPYRDGMRTRYRLTKHGIAKPRRSSASSRIAFDSTYGMTPRFKPAVASAVTAFIIGATAVKNASPV